MKTLIYIKSYTQIKFYFNDLILKIFTDFYVKNSQINETFIMSNEKISLSFTDGSSDKVYQAELKEVDGGFNVTFQYGRRCLV